MYNRHYFTIFQTHNFSDFFFQFSSQYASFHVQNPVATLLPLPSCFGSCPTSPFVAKPTRKSVPDIHPLALKVHIHILNHLLFQQKQDTFILLDMLPTLRTIPLQQGENAHPGIFREAGASPARTRRRDRGQGPHICHCPKGWEDAWPRMIRESEDRPCSVHIVCAPTGTWAAALTSPPFPKKWRSCSCALARPQGKAFRVPHHILPVLSWRES